ncbi:hypothetical protein JCM18909_1134 [Cutibacterium acnes JCM 18909]|nr:hypothetical protein JCM18909_1134 [Cutibacterium acnes JCM 18909]
MRFLGAEGRARDQAQKNPWPWTYKVSWPTKRSTGKCKLSQESLGAGYYVATVNLGGGPSGRFVMRMGA